MTEFVVKVLIMRLTLISSGWQTAKQRSIVNDTMSQTEVEPEICTQDTKL